MMKNVGIIGVGKYLPKKMVTNHDFVKMGLDTSDEWIIERTGIKQRYVAEKESTSDLAYEAAMQAAQAKTLSPNILLAYGLLIGLMLGGIIGVTVGYYRWRKESYEPKLKSTVLGQ